MIVDGRITFIVDGNVENKENFANLVLDNGKFKDDDIKERFDELDLFNSYLVDSNHEEVELSNYVIAEDASLIVDYNFCYDDSETWYGEYDFMEKVIELITDIVSPANFKIELRMEMTEGDWLTNFADYALYDSVNPSDDVNNEFNQMLGDVSDCCESSCDEEW